MSKMFPFITHTWNPLAGECLHKCRYCWVNELKNKFPAVKRKYSGKPKLIQKEIQNAIGGKHVYWNIDDFVFVCDCTDLFGHWVPDELIQQVLDAIRYRTNRFLLLTKNPERYFDFDIPDNCVAGATIESDIDYELTGPPVIKRLHAMACLKHTPKMISVEPIMKFSDKFVSALTYIHPNFVAVGYDNYTHGLVEPSLAETNMLISILESHGIKVYRKTLREMFVGGQRDNV